MKYKILFISLLFTAQVFGQGNTIRGRVVDVLSNEPLPFADVVIKSIGKGATTDAEGNYQITGLEAGLYNVTASFIGYTSRTEFEVQVVRNRSTVVNFRLREASNTLQEVTVSAQEKFNRSSESPVSLNTIGINEIQRNPGANQDISRVIQTLPGVASTPNFRNDIIIRGGGPNENRFFLDGIEIPAINHFATQGSSGGPVGLINVQFIREVDFYTGAFPVERGNALSSVMELKLKDGNDEKQKTIFQIGASEAGITLDGPLTKNTTYIASVRRSYLQLLFEVLGLPFLPTYTDYQFKTKTKLSDKSQLTILGLAAVGNFRLNLNANETEQQRYILAYLPVNEQWNYSMGAKYTYFSKNSLTNVVLSRFMLNNTAFKYQDNDESALKLLDYKSQEIENKLRIENIRRFNGWKFTTGGLFEQLKYNTFTLDRRFGEGQDLFYESDLVLYKYGAFAQASKSFFSEKLDLSAGIRAEGVNFNERMANPLQQLSPRISASYNINNEWSINANWGIYRQLAPFTTYGFRDSLGNLVNQDQANFIRSDHYIAGVTWYPKSSSRISVEAFYKRYFYYPFLLRDSVSLANLGGDFGVIGNDAATFDNEGRAYGLELSYQQKLVKGFFGIFALTFVRSEFQDVQGNFAPSSWDNRVIATFTGGKRFGKNWEFGAQYQYLGGNPFTPIDIERSGLIANFNRNSFGFPDFSQLNTGRTQGFHRVNVRIDKKWFFAKYNLNVFFDIQNLLAQAPLGAPLFDAVRNEMGNPLVDPMDPNRYQTRFIEQSSASPLLPSIGLIFDF